MDSIARSMYYGAPAGQQPLRVPPSALRLVGDLTQATDTRIVPPAETAPTVAAPAAGGGPLVPVTSIRQQLAASAKQLYELVDPGWKEYLAWPREVFQEGSPPSPESLNKALARYERVAKTPAYEPLFSRKQFQTTYGLLREYVENMSTGRSAQLPLPPPPAEF